MRKLVWSLLLLAPILPHFLFADELVPVCTIKVQWSNGKTDSIQFTSLPKIHPPDSYFITSLRSPRMIPIKTSTTLERAIDGDGNETLTIHERQVNDYNRSLYLVRVPSTGDFTFNVPSANKRIRNYTFEYKRIPQALVPKHELEQKFVYEADFREMPSQDITEEIALHYVQAMAHLKQLIENYAPGEDRDAYHGQFLRILDSFAGKQKQALMEPMGVELYKMRFDIVRIYERLRFAEARLARMGKDAKAKQYDKIFRYDLETLDSDVDLMREELETERATHREREASALENLQERILSVETGRRTLLEKIKLNGEELESIPRPPAPPAGDPFQRIEITPKPLSE